MHWHNFSKIPPTCPERLSGFVPGWRATAVHFCTPHPGAKLWSMRANIMKHQTVENKEGWGVGQCEQRQFVSPLGESLSLHFLWENFHNSHHFAHVQPRKALYIAEVNARWKPHAPHVHLSRHHPLTRVQSKAPITHHTLFLIHTPACLLPQQNMPIPSAPTQPPKGVCALRNPDRVVGSFSK